MSHLTPPPSDPSQPFTALLDAQARGAGLRKSERTRCRLLAATAGCLDRLGPRRVRVADICDAAQVAQGTFYLYFTTRDQAVGAVAEAFCQHILDVLDAASRLSCAADERVQGATLAYVLLFQANPGLMRCLFDAGADVPQCHAALHRLNGAWLKRAARSLGGAAGLPPLAEAYALGGMIDEFLINLYLRQDPHLVALALSTEDVARLLTSLWQRAATPRRAPALSADDHGSAQAGGGWPSAGLWAALPSE